MHQGSWTAWETEKVKVDDEEIPDVENGEQVIGDDQTRTEAREIARCTAHFLLQYSPGYQVPDIRSQIEFKQRTSGYRIYTLDSALLVNQDLTKYVETLQLTFGSVHLALNSDYSFVLQIPCHRLTEQEHSGILIVSFILIFIVFFLTLLLHFLG